MASALADAFVKMVGQLTASNSTAASDWKLTGKNGEWTLVVPKVNPSGFEVTVVTAANEVTVYTEFYAHRHFTSDGNHQEVCGHALGLVRDLLASNMRLRVLAAGGTPYRATLEVFHNDRWKRDGSTGLFVFPFFRKRTEQIYSNNRLPAREPFMQKS